jgi:hypothetical protein
MASSGAHGQGLVKPEGRRTSPRSMVEEASAMRPLEGIAWSAAVPVRLRR